MPSRPTSVFSSAGATRRERSPSAIAFAVIAIFSIARTPCRSSHHAAMHNVNSTARAAATSTETICLYVCSVARSDCATAMAPPFGTPWIRTR